MLNSHKFLIFCALLLPVSLCYGQRIYKPSSVLATGNWYKFSINQEGVYKLDLPFLNKLGITGSVPSAQVRLYGNGGGMLPEANGQPRLDDLEENSIWVEDGGDGVLNGADYILFFAEGPDHWVKDSVNKTFSHRKNLYSDRAFYYLTIGGAGRRIMVQDAPPQPITTVTSYDDRYFHELDSVNFLNSGKEWYGEEFSNLPGRPLSRVFLLPFTDVIAGQAFVNASYVARSVNTASLFAITVNGQQVQQLSIPGISTNQYDLFAQQVTRRNAFTLTQPATALTISFGQGSFNSQGWLNWFEFFCRRNLAISTGKQLLFRDWSSVVTTGVQFQLANAEAITQAWEVTDPLHPVKMMTTLAGNILQFSNDASRLREYVAFSNTFLVPTAIGPIANQNLHAGTMADYFIVTDPSFLNQANRIAAFHKQRRNLTSTIVTTEQIYNEFSSGIPDPVALRDFIKMYYDRYRTNWKDTGKYLLLLGKGSFDYKNRINNNTNYVPVYETNNSLDPLATYTSDDFFGFLDDHEDINSSLILNQLDLGIGRIPATSEEEVKNFVEKLYDYHAPEAFGSWRNNLSFIADDEDQNLHLQDAEVLTGTVSATAPVFNNQKIYLDAFLQERGSSGGRYPQANAAINNAIYNGTLIFNYSGHGGPDRLAEEVILDQSIVNSWNNRYRLPLFITATCDFAPYDHPLLHSLGENLVVRPKTGAIALMTTTRVVFAFSNRIMNDNYLRIALQPDSNGRYKSLGEAVMAAKNYTYQTSGDITNNRKFSLLGDPAMTVAYPVLNIVATTINGHSIVSSTDTLSATEIVKIEGEVRDHNGQLLLNFNGTISLSVFDKPVSVTTLGNDPSSIPVSYSDQFSVLFKGKATVRNGRYSIEFKMPKDINYQYGAGKVSLYADNGIIDGNGYTNNVIIGGIESNADTDKEGPEIKAFLNDDRFVNGGLTNSNPVLILHLSDSSGINTGSSGIDHDLIATLDNDNRTYYQLNNFYESEVDNYRKGQVRFQLPKLSSGHHSLKIKAWDVLNNSSEYVLEFTVMESDVLKIDHVLNYPNPFSTNTAFWFEHNAAGTELTIKVEIFTVSGKLIKTLSQTINQPGNRSSEVDWDGLDEYGNKIANGVYLYRLRVQTPDGRSAQKWEKLVILK